MKTATELSLFLENKPGALASVLADLKKRQVNLEAITIVDHTDHALVRMIVGDKKRALQVLEGAGLLVIAATVLRIEASNRSLRTRSKSATVASISASVKVRAVSCISTRIARVFLPDSMPGPR